MRKVITTSLCQRTVRRRFLRKRTKAIQTKGKQLKRGLSKSVLPQSGGLESLPQRTRSKRLQVQCTEYIHVQSCPEKIIPTHPETRRTKLHLCGDLKCVQPETGEILQPDTGKYTQSRLAKPRAELVQSGKLEIVQAQCRKLKCANFQTQEPEYTQLQCYKLLEQKDHHKALQIKSKKPKFIQSLSKMAKQPGVPLSLRIQTQMAIKNSQEETKPAEMTPTEKRKSERMNTKVSGTQLHTAASKGHFTRVKAYLSEGCNPNLPNHDGWTALHDACLYGREKVVTLLLKSDANVNAADDNGETPLFDAVTAGNLKIVKSLIKHGADPQIKNKMGQEASYFANSTIKHYLQNYEESRDNSATPTEIDILV